MIDDLSTRAAMTFAAFLLLATGLSVLSLSGDSVRRESIQGLSEHIARELEAIGRFDASVSVRFGSDESAAVRLPGELGGRPYRLELRANEIRVISDAGMALEPIRIPVHPFPPERTTFTTQNLRDLDRATTLQVGSGLSFVAVRVQVLLEGTPVYLTFVHMD